MADRNNPDSRNHLSINAIQQVPKDIQGFDNPLPLSPQWLLPKPGENKHGVVTGESHLIPCPGFTSHSDISKPARSDEEIHDTEKKKDVFRPPFNDVESGRRDRWRDEERDNSAIRRDRWRAGDKELGDTRKMDRWMDSSMRHSGEARRVPSERWGDSSNRDSNYDQRRESKWNTRWGPDDKESESWREKWLDSSRDGEVPRDKILAHLTNHGKEDREGDQYRPWRSNSSQSRGRGEPPHHQTLTPNKQIPTFSYGRGRGENAPTFSVGRGRVSYGGSAINSISSQSHSHSHSLGTVLDKDESAHGDPFPLKYSRTKLLDIYRMTDVRSCRRQLDGFIDVPPSLTHAELLEPLALSAPNPEELVILKGIDKGDVVSSGAPQISKDASLARNSTDVQSGQAEFGSREDLPSALDDYKDESAGRSKSSHFKCGSDLNMEATQSLRAYHDSKFSVGDSGAPGKRTDEVANNVEVGSQGSSTHPPILLRSQSMGEHSHVPLNDLRDLPSEVRSRNADMGWSPIQKNQDMAWENSSSVASSYYKDELNWKAGEDFHSDITRDSIIKRQLSEVLDRERETRNSLPQPSPDDLTLYYKDPQGEIQGPFSGSDLIGWFDAGYFGIDLQVRVVSASPDTPFSLLGDVMPHLRAKARPPPGFGSPQQGEIAETINRPTFSSLGKLYTSSSEVDSINNEPRNRHESVTEAEKRFLESLMSGNKRSSPLEKFALSEGLQGYIGNNLGGIPPMVESGNDLNYLLAQRMSMERQRSLPTPHSYWQGRDAASMVPKAEIAPESLAQHSKLLSTMADNPHQIPHSQNVDLMSILQGVPDKSSSSAVNNGATSWANFPVQGGLDMRQDKVDMHHNQLVPPQATYGVQPQWLQQPNQSSLSNIIPQIVGHPSGIVTQEKLLSSGRSPDSQMLSLLQQQYLLSQLQLQAQAPVPTQLSLLDKLLLLKQQQNQEQQQQLLRQQQQHLLSQVLSEHQSHMHFSETYGPLQAGAIPAGNGAVDHLALRSPHDVFHVNSQLPISNLQDEIMAGTATLPSQVSQDIGYHVSSDTAPLHLPHQLFENTTHQKGKEASQMEQIDRALQKDLLHVPAVASTLYSEVVENSSHEPSVPLKHEMIPDSSASVIQGQSPHHNRIIERIAVHTSEAVTSFMPSECTGIPDSVPMSGTGKNGIFISDQISDAKISLPDEVEVQKEQCDRESPLVKEAKCVEVRELKKTSEKKSRKQKNSKAQSFSDAPKGVSNSSSLQQSKQSEVEETDFADSHFDIRMDAGEDISGTVPLKTTEAIYGITSVETMDSQQIQSSLSRSISSNKVETVEGKDGSREVDSLSLQNRQTHLGHRAWKPAPSLKAKSLLEIQQEEQRTAQTEMAVNDITTSVNAMISSIPWTGIVTNSELKTVRDNFHDANIVQIIPGKSDNASNAKGKKSQLHDLLAEEVLTKSHERAVDDHDNVSSLPSLPFTANQMDSAIDDDDFIQAKDTKKSRKKSAKGKGLGVKASTPVTSFDASVASSPIEKGKSSRQGQQEKEVLPAPPSGPSLGDFVLWKGEQANPSPAPAWSTDSGKFCKPTSLRDIQKEQEKKAPSVLHQVQIPTQKAQPVRSTRGNGTSWPLSGSSPSKAAPPIEISSIASAQTKSKEEDDLFWGPLGQSKQEAKQSDFPSLANPSSWGKKSTPVKVTLGGSSGRQKSMGGRPANNSLSSSPGAAAQSSLKERRDAITKHSEAMDFRDWCESETVRLTGSKDTSFLEFCLKQSTSEAETLLIENLGSFDPDHEFIDKFLNYKELLPADILEIAFQGQTDQKFARFGVGDVNTAIGDLDPDVAGDSNEPTKGGGKKKVKKGKKVSPSVLGFNVVSNRIMKGEIQSVED